MKHNHKLFLDIAQRISEESTATRLKVGAVVAKDGSIIDFGYNGTVPGWHTNECEYEAGYFQNEYAKPAIWVSEGLKTKPEVLHAEQNLFMKCAKLGKSTQGAILYLTHAPCVTCSLLIVASGISQVFYLNKYRDSTGLDILEKGNVKVTQWDTDTITQ